MNRSRAQIVDKPQNLDWAALNWRAETSLQQSPPRAARPLPGMQNPYIVVFLVLASSLFFLGVLISFYFAGIFKEVSPLVLVMIAVLGILFEGGVGLFMKSKVDQRKRILERGEVTKGFVQSIETVRVGKGVQRIAKVIYESSGTFYELTTSIPFTSSLPQGSATSVIFDPIDPASAILYEGCGFRVA